tara:strand:- start:6253 stop:6864 length:612 start_codon:yes stop_codon:yes gene_type:complete
MSLKNLLIAIILGVALAAGIFLSVRMAGEASVPETATVLPSPVTLPAFSLVDHTGAAADESVFNGQWNLVFFGFTHCPDVCPLTLQTLAAANRQLADMGYDELPRIVLVSVDPERDTPGQLATYLKNFGDHNLGLTGDVAEIRKLTEALGIYFDKVDTDADYYVVDHSAVVIVIGPDGRYRALFSSPHKPEQFVHDLPLLMKL